jgi:hypothetical protein
MYPKATTDYAQRFSTEYPPILHLTDQSGGKIPGRFGRIVQALTGLEIDLVIRDEKFFL